MENIHDSTKDKKTLDFRINLILAMAGLAISGALIGYIGIFNAGISNDISVWGQTGDFFGGVLNPLFGLLSIVALLTALGQNHSILTYTREELNKSTTALEKQNEYINKQGFEGTYFELLKIFKDIVNSNTLDNEVYQKMQAHRLGTHPFPDTQTHKGNSALTLISSQLHDILKVSAPEYTQRIDFINREYSYFYRQYEPQIGPYIRFLSEIFGFIENGEIHDKDLYFNFLRSMVSDAELLILFYHSISKLGENTVHPLIVEYNFLNHLNTRKLAHDDDRVIFNEIFNKN